MKKVEIIKIEWNGEEALIYYINSPEIKLCSFTTFCYGRKELKEFIQRYLIQQNGTEKEFDYEKQLKDAELSNALKCKDCDKKIYKKQEQEESYVINDKVYCVDCAKEHGWEMMECILKRKLPHFSYMQLRNLRSKVERVG